MEKKRMNNRRHHLAAGWLVSFLLLVFSATAGFAQGIVTGSISGTVYDSQKAVISGAKVTVVQSGTNSSGAAKTNGEGYFPIPNLPVDTYTVTIESPKFANLKLNDVDVKSGENSNIGSMVMTVGTT